MSKDFQRLKEIYDSIYNITLEISSFIENADIRGVSQSLEKRRILIDEADNILLNNEFSLEEKDNIDNFVKKIRGIEDKNLQEMQDKQNLIRKELLKINKNYKALSSYKFNKEIGPNIIDSKE